MTPAAAWVHNDALTTAGIPFDAVDFYAELALNNNRDWWAANAEPGFYRDEHVFRPVAHRRRA